MGNIIPHDEIVYLVAMTKYLPDPWQNPQAQITQPLAKQAPSQGLVSHLYHRRTFTESSQFLRRCRLNT